MRVHLAAIAALALAGCVPAIAPADDAVHVALAQAFPEDTLYGAAHNIMHCESGHNARAVNGQYRGLFQLGYNYNGTIAAHGNGDVFDPLTNALSARVAYNARGNWSAWSCRP